MSKVSRLSDLHGLLLETNTLRMRIRPQERLFTAGRTGSGKTTLVRSLLTSAQGSRIAWTVLDPKYDYEPPRGVPVVPAFVPGLPWQVVRVPPSDDEQAGWDDAIEGAWLRGDSIIYVDELTLINPSPRTLRPALGRAIRTGRSRGVGVWMGTQRPKDIPSACFTEAEHFAIFQLSYSADRDKVTQFTHDNMGPSLGAIRRHEYVYYSIFTETPITVDGQGRIKRGRVLQDRAG